MLEKDFFAFGLHDIVKMYGYKFTGIINGIDVKYFSPANAEDITKTDFGKGALCVIGNEGNGVSKEIIDACDKKITIKMQGRAESLNAAAAASITMWELVK